VLQWLIFASASMGPYLGQAYHFRNNAPDRHAYAIERYSREAARLAQIVDRRLDRHEFLGCDRFSIADIAAYPWLARWQKLGIDAEALPNLRRWLGVVAALPAVERGMAVLAEMQRTGPMSAETWEIYYGESQRRQRLG
jgi:GST-like protein